MNNKFTLIGIILIATLALSGYRGRKYNNPRMGKDY